MHLLTMLVCAIAAIALAVIFLFASIFVFSMVVMAVGRIGNLLSGRPDAGDQAVAAND